MSRPVGIVMEMLPGQYLIPPLVTILDVLTLSALSLPMCLLYESCIWIAWFMERKAAWAEPL